MSRVIICSDIKAKEPFVMKSSGRKVYTVEELCYCLRDELEMLDEESLGQELATFLGEELGFKDREMLLTELIRTGGDLKSRLEVVLSACDLYTSDDINKICDEFERNINMTPTLRAKRIADRNLAAGRFKEALRGYREIVSREPHVGIDETDLALVFHNLGIIKIKTGYPSDAAKYFLQGYAHNCRESLKAYMLTLKLMGDDEAFIKASMQYFDSGEQVKEIEEEIAEEKELFKRSGGLDIVERLRTADEENLPSGFENLASETVLELKAAYREADEN